MYSPVILSTFILLCNDHQHSSPELFSHYKTETLYPLKTFFDLKFILPVISISTPTLFWLLSAWTFPILSLVSCRQTAYSWIMFLLTLPILPISVFWLESFNPFTFKVVTDKEGLLSFCCLFSICLRAFLSLISWITAFFYV